ncbi:MAG TPA: ParA family protein [Stellaceae bacterium]|nr:ParA family protein [Stellaceae bacterium]
MLSTEEKVERLVDRLRAEHSAERADEPSATEEEPERLVPLPEATSLAPVPYVGRSTNMRVIVVASQKGGSGKTTIAAHLAVQAGLAGDGPAVLVDADWQGSLAEWWRARNDGTLALATVTPGELTAMRADELAANLAELRRRGFAVAIIDTPPARTAAIAQVIAIADLVVIPARPSPHDLRAVGATVDMARRAGKPFLFVVNGAAPRANITVQAVAALSEHGPVAPVILYQRTDYAASMIDGRSVIETAASSRSAREIAELWKFVHARISMRAAA